MDKWTGGQVYKWTSVQVDEWTGGQVHLLKNPIETIVNTGLYLTHNFKNNKTASRQQYKNDRLIRANAKSLIG
ncbi:hypothetical protein [Peptostreptococcus faecalis]|uniref:hypothetical protein n=1 Tax=Peptostreptococcus faecalis TaxID=2045015 RepID=UPI0011AF6182|nr:hypothetical protein [Peptostreptococcus faecalis]